MPNRGRIRSKPREFVARGAFPDGPLKSQSPAAAWWAAEIARRLRDAIAEASLSEVARDADLARSTIYDIVSGETWPDVVSIVKLQDALNTRLWPPWKPRSRP